MLPPRSDFSRIAVINLILRNARSHLRDECPLTAKSVRLSAAAAIAAKGARARMRRSKDRCYSITSSARPSSGNGTVRPSIGELFCSTSVPPMAVRSRVCCTDTDMLVADDLSRTSAIGGDARGVAGAVHADALQQWRQCFDLAIAENATASTNTAVPTIHNRKSPRRQFIVGSSRRQHQLSKACRG